MSLLGIGSILLGAKTLEEFGLALLIGLISGAYSSIFIASPLLAIMKEREPRNRDVRRRIETRTTSRRAAEREPVEAESTAPDGEELREPVTVPAAAGGSTRVASNIPPRPRKKGKRR
jgi:preprotein translocase subunit SecF